MQKILFSVVKFFITILMTSYLLVFTWVASAKHVSTPLPADAIIVLGAAAWGELPSPVFRNRINYAIDLYKKGLTDYIIFTGGTPKKNYPSEAEVATKWALSKNVPITSILTDHTSRNTYENLLHAKKIAAQHKLNTFIIISDSYHLNRAKVISLLLGMNVKTAATPYSSFDQKNWKIKFRTYFKETNSIYIAIIYHFIYPLISKNLSTWL